MLVGGYLVLHRPHHALIAGASARFHTTAAWEEATNTSAVAAPALAVRVTSPQFHSDSEFRLAATPPHVFDGEEPPSFISLAIRVALLAAGEAGTAAVAEAASLGKRLHLTLRADNDFYSQLPFLRVAGQAVSAAALKRVPAFQPPPTEDALAEAEAALAGVAAASPDGRDPAAPGGAGGEPAIRKTGLGSSAALTVSLTAAFARALGILPGEDPGSSGPVGALGKAWLMRCGQVSHGLAQGKVGSGFDVSAAVLGTQLYLRVSRDALADAMAAAGAALRAEATGAERAAGSAALAGSGMEGSQWWDLEAGPAGLPACMDLLLADVSGGSSTPSMVRRIEAWRTEGEAQAALWEEVAAGTTAAQLALAGVAEAEAAAGDDSVTAALAHAAATTAPAWSLGLPAEGARDDKAALLLERLAAAAAALAAWRALMRRMGEDAGVPIEPASQTALLEATQALPGVVAAAVPGGECQVELVVACVLAATVLCVFLCVYFGPSLLTALCAAGPAGCKPSSNWLGLAIVHRPSLSRAPLPPCLLAFAAGGFDAIYVLCVRDPAVRASVEACWLDFKGEGGQRVVPLLLSAEPDDLVRGGVHVAHGHPSL